jgi:hypothetical protein
MDTNRLEELNAQLFRRLTPDEELRAAGGYTAIITQRPTLLNGVRDITIDVGVDA